MENTSKMFLIPMLSGGAAGLSVDLSLYPIDTLKTRLQSRSGFWASGGFSGVYRGIGAVVIGSVPSAALFFLSYEAVKSYPGPDFNKSYQPFVNMLAASFGEIMACIVRVPTEIAKQRKQALGSTLNKSSFQILSEAYRTEGFRNGLYRGFMSTVMRDLPFSFIQFPLWEYFKVIVADQNSTETTNFFQSALCGSLSGAIAGGLTTPLDVAKTRIMLAPASSRQLTVGKVLKTVYSEKGARGLFAGLFPRITGFALGGFIFLGAYDFVSSYLKDIYQNPS